MKICIYCVNLLIINDLINDYQGLANVFALTDDPCNVIFGMEFYFSCIINKNSNS